MFFQILTRSIDKHGNSYKIILFYNCEGIVINAHKTSFNIGFLVDSSLSKGLIQLPTFRVTVQEFNDLEYQHSALISKD